VTLKKKKLHYCYRGASAHKKTRNAATASRVVASRLGPGALIQLTGVDLQLLWIVKDGDPEQRVSGYQICTFSTINQKTTITR